MIRMALAAALAALTMAGAASAATMGFKEAQEAGFSFDPIRIVNGNCRSGSCAALNDNETITMTRAVSGAFDLYEIGFSLLGRGQVIRARDKKPNAGGGNTLTLTTDQGLSLSFSTTDYKHNEDHVVKLDPTLFSGVRSVTFSTGAGGNVRLDGLAASAFADPAGSAPAVPLPATAWLLLGALGGLGGLRLRRARNA